MKGHPCFAKFLITLHTFNVTVTDVTDKQRCHNTISMLLQTTKWLKLFHTCTHMLPSEQVKFNERRTNNFMYHHNISIMNG